MARRSDSAGAAPSRVSLLRGEALERRWRQIYAAYRSQFAGTETESPSLEVLGEQSFSSILSHEDSFAIVVERESELVGVCVVTRALELLEWISEPYYEKRFPEHYRDRRLFYFVSMSVDDKYSNSLRTFYAMIDAAVIEVAGVDGIAAFDFRETEMTRRNAELIERRAAALTEVAHHRIGVQHYHAIETSGLRLNVEDTLRRRPEVEEFDRRRVDRPT